MRNLCVSILFVLMIRNKLSVCLNNTKISIIHRLGKLFHKIVTSLRLYMLQRLTALIMAPLVIGHIAVMIYAVQGGLTVDEILARTQGSVAWFLFYGSFVVAVSIHGAIGLRVISFEWFGLNGRALQLFSWAVFALLFGLGAKAVYAVTFAGVGL